MRYTFRAGGLAVLTALLTAVLMLRPTEPPAATAGTTTTAAQPAELSADLALVPADAIGFVHLRLADLWKNEVMSGFRKTWEKAGPKALAALDAQFVPPPSTISRVTAFVMLDDHKNPQVVSVLAFSAPFKPEDVVKTYLPKGAAEKVGGKTVYRDPNAAFEFYFPDNKHIVIGMENSLDTYLAKAPAKDGPLTSALKLASGGSKVLVAAADISALPIPPELLEEVPEDVRPILKAKQLTLAVDLGDNAQFDIRATYANAAAAQDAEKAVKALADLGRKELAKIKKELEDKLYDPNIKTPRPIDELPEAIGTVFAIGAITRLDETLADPKFITRNGAELAVAVPMPKELLTLLGGTVAVAAAAMLPAASKLRDAAGGLSSASNLKQLGLAIHSYHDAFGFMPRDIVDKDGKPILSWRVAILPYIEQEALYKQFKLDEPWDSENNKPLSQTMVKLFLSPNATLPAKPEWGLTSYRGIAGKDAIFEPGAKITLASVTDGLSNTIMVIETDELVPWAKPGDYPFDAEKDLPKIVPPGKKNAFMALFGDGTVKAIRTNAAEKTLKALFTRNGGEIVDEKDFLAK